MTLQIKKSKDRFMCPAFLDYVRTLPCEDCKALGLVQTLRTTASHLISVKWAEGSDALAVPQCLGHHPQSSNQAAVLLASHGVDVEALHRKLWSGFLESNHVFRKVRVSSQEEFERLCRELGFVTTQNSKRKNRKPLSEERRVEVLKGDSNG